MATKTSFQKKARGKIFQIPGTRPSLFNNQLLVSTGIPSLDHVLGGGVAVGTVLLVEEDLFGDYGRLVVKYFCSEAVMTGQSLLLASADINPTDLTKDLPAPIIDQPKDDTRESGDKQTTDSDMKIAWRYENLPKFQSNPSGIKFGHYYDLSKTMETRLVESINIKYISSDNLYTDSQKESGGCRNCEYNKLLEIIKTTLDTSQYSTTSQITKDTNILKIAIHSLGSPLWDENGGLKDDGKGLDSALPRFLLALRSLLRTSFSVGLITIPTHLFQEECFIRRIEKLCDTVIHLESFSGSEKEKNPVFKEYHGLLNIVQLPRLNSMTSHQPDTLDLAFKLRRKKFTIEQLHLPPELGESGATTHDPLQNLKSTGCTPGGAGNSKLDF
ncbi:hypothetical protein LOTGIDRAFT_121862 [Lottia gigantea]|uniref:Elongator complex protein 4 n=1 Tax=Lottia gigantea TaxID=225164 RepID=V4A920_LOTGI|nr:hypothetical protein LOTGIDRAFT_121862 [Lottia gigantea]ESO91550.1 hypothetical protein LOTGIDRAFT_121862 [Lottia gigantea]